MTWAKTSIYAVFVICKKYGQKGWFPWDVWNAFPVSVRWLWETQTSACPGYSWVWDGASLWALPLLKKSFSSLLSELWLVVPGGDYLCDAVWIPAFLLQTPQPDHPKGHAEKDHDRQFWVSRGGVEPDLRDGQRCCEEVSLWTSGRWGEARKTLKWWIIRGCWIN